LNPRSLARRGVLGMNARNSRYIAQWNPRHLFPRVDDKVRSKRLLLEAGVAVPDEIGVVRIHHEIRRIVGLVADEAAFVLKPARGSQGNGILLVRGREAERLLRRRQRADLDRIRFHASEILSGLYSLGGQPDAVLIEALVEPDPKLTEICGEGVPDLRMLIYRGVPVMAMLRLPTERSGGRANLHQGAVGVGVDLARGEAAGGVLEGRRVGEHPDTERALSGWPIPRFDECMENAVRSADAIGLGYVGVDIVVDQRHGPQVLEVNARPGLSIQLANRRGLRGRLDAVDAEGELPTSIARRIALARSLDGAST